MPDRIDREIEEILAKLGEEPPPPGEEPISLEQRRRRRRTPFARRAGAAFGLSLSAPKPASVLFTGAGVMVVGFILSTIWDALIWLAFAGVALFLAGFIQSFLRPRRAGGGAQPAAKGAHWRGRYVEYDPPPAGMLARIKRAFRKR